MGKEKIPRSVGLRVQAWIEKNKGVKPDMGKFREMVNGFMAAYWNKGDSPARKARRLRQLEKGMISTILIFCLTQQAFAGACFVSLSDGTVIDGNDVVSVENYSSMQWNPPFTLIKFKSGGRVLVKGGVPPGEVIDKINKTCNSKNNQGAVYESIEQFQAAKEARVEEVREAIENSRPQNMKFVGYEEAPDCPYPSHEERVYDKDGNDIGKTIVQDAACSSY